MAAFNREAMLAFVDTCVTSFEAWDIVSFVAAHPDTGFTLERLAEELGRRTEDLAPAAALLEMRGVLVGEPGGAEWRLCDVPEVRAEVAAFDEAVGNSKERLTVLTRVLSNLSR